MRVLEDCKSGPLDKISEAVYKRWKGIMLANIKKNAKFLPFLSATWEKPTVENRGQVNGENITAQQKAADIDALLAHISHYGPAALQRDITKRCKSLSNVWKDIRTWAGLKSTGNNLLAYYQARRSWNPDTISPVDFYYKLFNSKEDCLLQKNGQINFLKRVI